MNRKLYEIDNDIAKVFEQAVDPDTGEIIDEEALDKLDKLDIERSTKIDSVAEYYDYLLSMASQAEAKKKADDECQKYWEKRADGVKKYLTKALNGEKFKSATHSVSFRHTKAVDVPDPKELPESYQRIKTTVEADKAQIKKALELGFEIKGAKLVENVNTIIK